MKKKIDISKSISEWQCNKVEKEINKYLKYLKTKVINNNLDLIEVEGKPICKNRNMKQLTEKQAIEFAQSGIWKQWTDEQIVRFQLFQNRLCMDFSRFHEAISKVLSRPVYTHEFMESNHEQLIKEYLGEKQPPTIDEIIGMIPEEKRIIILS